MSFKASIAGIVTLSSKQNWAHRCRLQGAHTVRHSYLAPHTARAQAASKNGPHAARWGRHHKRVLCTIIIANMAAEEGPVIAKDLTDNELVGKMYAGESGWEDHFGTLYGRYRGRLLRYFLVRGLTPEDAEDGAENCFYKVLDTVGSSSSAFNSDLGPFRSWLFRIAHNEWINIVRAKSKYADSADTNDDDEPRDIMAEFAAVDQPVDIALEKQELVDLLHACISTLKPKEREIIALRLSEEPHSAIAELLHISENYAMVLHCLALGKVKKCFFERLNVRRICR